MFNSRFDEKSKLWSSCGVPSLYHPKISLGQVILRAGRTHGQKIAQINNDSGIQLCYDEIRIKTIRAAQNLQKRGYNSKELFCVVAKNSHHLSPILFASLALGSPVNPLDPSFGKTELVHMLNTTKPGLMFCDVSVYALVKECLSELGNSAKIFTFGGSQGDSEPVEVLFEETHNESSFLPVEVDGENETAIIVCSSGTTGLPKGVCVSHAAMLDLATQLDVATSSDILLCFSSMYWISGWIILLLGTLNGATRIISTESFDADLQLSIIEKYKVTIAWSAPHHLTLMSKSERLDNTDLSSVRHQFVTGGRCSFQVQNDIGSKLPNGNVGLCYGLSESAGPVTVSLTESQSVGQVVSLSAIKIIDEEGHRLGVGEDGEICIKLHYPFLGYFGNKKATDEVFDDEGFFLTGDVGHFDAEGHLFIVDRRKELIKYCGFQVSPSEIELYLVGLPDIKAACVFGMPDEVATDLPAAFVIPNEGSNITKDDVFKLVEDHFADNYKLRGGVFFVDELPLTPSGKLLRKKAKELALNLLKSQ